MKLNNSFVAGQMISKSEMLAAGLPVGNPHTMQAPFNRRYEMPFFIAPAVTAASVAIGTAATVGSMAAIGTAALATVSAIGTIAAVAGTAMTVVGMITGDKGLMKLGGIVGLAGGVASLAAGGLAAVSAGAEFTAGTAGIEAANAANAAATNTANLAANGAITAAAPSALDTAIGTTSTQVANMSPTLSTVGTQANQAVNGLLGTTAGTVAPQASSLIGAQASGNLLTSSQALAAGGVGAQAAANTANAGFFSDLMSQMTAKDWAMLGGSAVIGGAKSMAAHAQTAAQQEYNDNLRAQRSKNLNTIPQLTTLGTLGTQPAGA